MGNKILKTMRNKILKPVAPIKPTAATFSNITKLKKWINENAIRQI